MPDHEDNFLESDDEEDDDSSEEDITTKIVKKTTQIITSTISNNIDVSSPISTFSSNISEFISNISELVINITELPRNITELSNNITELSSNITELSSNITELSSNITELSSDKFYHVEEDINIQLNITQISNNGTRLIIEHAHTEISSFLAFLLCLCLLCLTVACFCHYCCKRNLMLDSGASGHALKWLDSGAASERTRGHDVVSLRKSKMLDQDNLAFSMELEAEHADIAKMLRDRSNQE